MPRFRKRPLEVDAIRFTGNNAFEVWAFMGREDLLSNTELQTTDHPVIETREGDMTLTPGNWLIRGLSGEYYPCRQDIFEATYEPVVTRSRDLRVESAAMRSKENGEVVSLPRPARHGDIQLYIVGRLRSEKRYGEIFRDRDWEYGFLLSNGAFADRQKAAPVARRANQLIRQLKGGLTTDHLW